METTIFLNPEKCRSFTWTSTYPDQSRAYFNIHFSVMIFHIKGTERVLVVRHVT